MFRYCALCLLALSAMAVADDIRPQYQVLSSPSGAPEDVSRLTDLLAVMHGVSLISSTFRSSEMGHEAFNEELRGAPMAAGAERWLELVRDAILYAHEEGGLAGTLERQNESWRLGEPADLNAWALAAYGYHMHHRGSRWAPHGLQAAINYQPLVLISLPGRYVLDNHYADGLIFSDREQAQWDRSSFSQGLSAIHAPIYAWIRWHKPGGAEDMGQIPEERLKTHLGYGPDELLVVARALADTLDSAWDEEQGGYDFGAGTTTSLQDLGALLRGHKALYELLFVFGNEEDQAAAATLFDRAAQQVEAVAELVRPAGLPAVVRFSNGKGEPASEVVSMAAQWRYVMELSAGFAFMRENKDLSRFVERRRPQAGEAFGEMVDKLLLATERHGFLNDRLVGELTYGSHEDGVTVLDERESTLALGLYLTAAGNAYRSGGAFARASDWKDADKAVVDRSRRLYQRFEAQVERLAAALYPLEK